MRPDLDGGICDAEAARLLPWYVTERLTSADTVRVERHLDVCAICRADLDHERALRTALKADGSVEYAPQAGLAATLARIDELTREAPVRDAAPPASTAPVRFRGGPTTWLSAALVVQTVALGFLGSALFNRQSDERAQPRYATLSSPSIAAAGPRLRAVFSGTTTLAQLRAVLDEQHLLIVAGPTEAGALTLAVVGPTDSAGNVDAVLARLRQDPHVVFAEPAIADGGPAR